MENNIINPEKNKNEQSGVIDSIFYNYLSFLDRGRFGLKEKILMFKELSYLLKGGVSLVECINIIKTGTENNALINVLNVILNYIYKGKSLSYAFSRLPRYFTVGDYYILRSGEIAGNTPNVLQSLSFEYQFLSDIKNKYVGALIYPVLLVVISIVAVLALFIFVLPNILTLADSFQNIHLPWTTQFLRNISIIFQSRRQLILISCFAIGVLLSVYFSMDSGKKNRFNILFKIPLIGKMTKYFYLVRRCRYMKLMISSGMNYIQVFQLLREILGIPAYRDMIDRVISGLQKGEMIYSSLEKSRNIIPNDVMVLIKVGEETANLNTALDNILVLYEGELNDMINRLAKIIEPVMLIFIGGIVTVIALGVFGLIMQIMEGAGV